MSAYATLIGAKTTAGSIARWANSDAIDADTILTEAQALIYRELRVRQMIATPATGTMSVGVETLTLPTDFLDPIWFGYTGATYADKIDLKTVDEVENDRAYAADDTLQTGKPTIYYVRDGYAQFSRQIDIAYPYRLVYYKRPAALGSLNTTNFLTETMPRLLRAACLAAASEFLKKADDKAWWTERMAEEIARENQAGDRYRGVDIQVTTP